MDKQKKRSLIEYLKTAETNLRVERQRLEKDLRTELSIQLIQRLEAKTP